MARIDHHDIGDVWQPQWTFTNAVGAAADPTTVTVRVQNPAGVETAYVYGTDPEVQKDGTGVYYIAVTLGSAGYWYAKATGTGAVTAAETHEAIVDPDEFTADSGLETYALVRIGEVKDYLNQQNIDTSDDLLLAQLINGASVDAMEISGREFKTADAANTQRTFDIEEWRWGFEDGAVIEVGDLATYTSANLVAYDTTGATTTTTALTNVVTLPRNRKPWEPIRQVRIQPGVAWPGSYGAVTVTGNWGFPTVPPNVKVAVLEAVAYQFERDVENIRPDLTPARGDNEGGVQVNIGSSGAATVLSWPPRAFAVVNAYRDLIIV